MNIYVCPYCGAEVAETLSVGTDRNRKAYYKCLSKRCRWEGTDPGEVHGRVLE